MNKHRFSTGTCILALVACLFWVITSGEAQSPTKDSQQGTTVQSTAQQKTDHQRREDSKKALDDALNQGMGPVLTTDTLVNAPVLMGTSTPAQAPIANTAAATAILAAATNPLYPPGIGFNPAVDYTKPNFAQSPNIRKFIDALPGLGAANANKLGQYIPVAQPDTTTYPGTDFYDIACGQFTVPMSSDLPATTIRGYMQTLGTGAGQSSDPTVGGVQQYLGPAIIAKVNRPVRMLFRNQLPASNQTIVNGNPMANPPIPPYNPSDTLALPIDVTIMGAGMGPIMTPTMYNYNDNRVTVPHLHGGHTPWINDGTTHQWITPATDTTQYHKGVSFQNVPDMVGAGAGHVPGTITDGMATAFYSNQQSGRLMFYHDHAYGITRLNVYAGVAAPYLLVDQVEDDLISGTNSSGVFTSMGITPQQILPDQSGLDNGTGLYHYGIPLVIQDKAFVNDATTPLAAAKNAFPANTSGYFHTYNTSVTDPLWSTYVNAAGRLGGALWFPHEYMPIENIFDPTGNTPNGRWDYGPFMIPPMIPNNLTLPSPCQIPEAFGDTMVVNGCAFPYIELPPDTIRFRILGVGNDRVLNLQLYKADPLRINVTNGGSGYDSNAVVTVTDPCHFGTCTAKANVSKGEVTEIAVTDALYYITPPKVMISGGGGTGASAITILGANTTGAITDIIITNPGSGYTSAPTVTLIGGGGSYTAAIARVIPKGVIKSIDVTGATGYRSGLAAPVITIADASRSTGFVDANAVACVNTEVKMVDAVPNPAYPTWPTDGRDGGVPDPTTMGPDWILIGNESGLLAQEANLPQQPIDYEYVRQNLPLVGVIKKSLLIMPAQRVDVIVDLRGYHDGDTLILYNDAPAPMPNFWAMNDYYTDDPNLGNISRPTTPAGFGPNTRTVMQIRIKGTKAPGSFQFNLAALKNAIPKAFALSNEKPIVPQKAYQAAYPTDVTFAKDTYAQSVDTTLNLTGNAGPITMIKTTAPGNNYAVPPIVHIIPRNGDVGGATAVAGLNPCGGVTLLTTGSGYATAPTVTISAPTGGLAGIPNITATATATISGGGVTAINIVEPGSNYSTTVAPTVTFTGGTALPGQTIVAPTASAFVATANTVGSIQLTNVAINGGGLYTQQPMIYLTPAPGSNGMGASAVALISGAVAMTGKGITEGMDPDFGRMDIRMGSTPNPLTPSVGSGMVLGIARYIDPPTEFVNDGEATLWRISHIGVDSHALHFHLFDVQVVNRVDWTNVVKPPYPDEIGWRDTIRTNPLEDIIVAFRPKKMLLPFAIPSSSRLLDPTTPAGSTINFLPIAPPAGVAAVAQLSNVTTDFGWEYVWHCHMLGHEENDFMRPLVMNPVATSAYLVPLSPRNVAATAGNAQATVTFTAPAGNGSTVTGYTVTAIPAIAGASIGTDNNAGQTTRTHTISGLTNFSAYTFTVTATSAAGKGLTSNPSNSVTPTPPPPAAPTALVATLQAGPQVLLTWTDNATSETGFVVERSDNGGAFGAIAAPASLTGTGTVTYTDTTVTIGNSYAYRVKAVLVLPQGTISSAYATSGTVAVVVPAIPTNLTATIASATSVSLRWTDASNNETSFAVWRSDNGAAAVQVGTVTRTATQTTATGGTVTFTNTGLTAGNTYAYYVTAINIVGQSNASNTVTLSFTAPAAPTSLAVTAIPFNRNNDTVTLTWVNPAGNNQTSFSIQRANNSAFNGAITSTAAGTATTLTQNVRRGTTCYYRIRAVNSVGTSGWTNATPFPIVTP